jgi:hypothetical protein
MKRTLGNAKQNADGNAKQNIAVIISSGWHYNRSKFYETFTRYAPGAVFSLKDRRLGISRPEGKQPEGMARAWP